MFIMGGALLRVFSRLPGASAQTICAGGACVLPDEQSISFIGAHTPREFVLTNGT